MEKILFCRQCGAQLTRALSIRSGKDPKVRAPEFQDQAPITQTGVAFNSYQPLVRSYRDKPAPLEFTAQLWINPEDITKSVAWMKNRRRLSGCHGPSGLDGPNQVCRCGAEVGTRQADCFTPAVFVPEPKATELRDASETRLEEE